MKSIQLTQEHKDKLIEMAKTLFPDFTDYQFCDDVEGGWGDETFLLYRKGDKESNVLHWLEFCIFHLSDKLFQKLEEQTGVHQSNYRKEFIMVTMFVRDEGENFLEEPINYLYEQFKKL